MIKNLIFDFGDVFINLDKEGAKTNALELFGLNEFPKDLIAINTLYEQGLISTDEFLKFYGQNFKHLSEQNIVDAWNYILKDFPTKRYEFVKELANKGDYRLFLLSNTNDMQREGIKQNVSFYDDFKSCFEQFYLSHEIGLRKPNADIFNFVMEENHLLPKESLFVDDTQENTETAETLGLHTWNIDETRQDVITLFDTKAHLF